MSEAPVRNRWTRCALLALSAIALNRAVRVSTGTLSPSAIRWLLFAIVVLLVGVFGPAVRSIEVRREKAPLLVLACGLVFQFAQIFRESIAFRVNSPLLYSLFIAGVAVCAALIIAAGARRLSGNSWFVAIAILHFCLGVAYLRIWGVDVIDVLVYQQEASAALLSGHNPYTITIPNVYPEGSPLYDPVNVVNGRIPYGFPYPPLPLLLCLPSYLLTGDVRYSHLLAISLAGLMIGLSGRSLMSKLAALIFLFSPDVFYVVQQSWTEAFVVLLLSIVLFRSATGREPMWALGLLVASKQYLVMAVPLAVWHLLRKQSLREWLVLVCKIGIVSLAITLPFVLWNFKPAYIAIMGHLGGGFRTDALSIPAWFVSLGWPQPPTWPAFVASTAAGLIVLRNLRPSPASFAACLAVMFMLLFSLNRAAFMNYYFMIGACICGAIAASDQDEAEMPPYREAHHVRACPNPVV